MKKKLNYFFLILNILLFIQIFASCSSHTHTLSSWKYDEIMHWQECLECHQKENEVFHTYNKWTVLLEATEDSEGLREHTCTVCGYVEQEAIPAISHTHSYGKWEIVKIPDLENSGEIKRVCAFNEKHIETSVLPALNKIDYSYTILKDATCGEAGLEQYKLYKDGQALGIELSISKLPHPFTEDWSTNETHHWHNTLCEHTEEKIEYGPHHFNNGFCIECHQKENEATHIHQFGLWEVTLAPTSTKEGKAERVCKTNENHVEEFTLPMLNQDVYEYSLQREATSSEEGLAYFTYTLGEQNIRIEERIPKIDHTYSDAWESNRTHHWHKALCEHTDEKKDYAPHTFDKGICIECSYVNISTGLEYMLNIDGMSYSVVGIGTVKDIEIVIPQEHNGYPVTHIAANVFKDCTFVKSVILLGGIEQIEKFAFSNCSNLTSVELCSSLKWIEESAFSNCSSLEQIHLPEGLEGLRDRAFSDCKKLQRVEIPGTLKEFGNYVFSGCSGLEYTSYDSGLYIGNQQNPYLIYMQTEDTLIVEANLHLETRFLNSDAFSECRKLVSIILPEELLSIGNHCFYYCEGLTSIQIGQKLLRIGQSAFSHCSSLTTVYFKGDNELWNQIEILANNEVLLDSEIIFISLEEN